MVKIASLDGSVLNPTYNGERTIMTLVSTRQYRNAVLSDSSAWIPSSVQKLTRIPTYLSV